MVIQRVNNIMQITEATIYVSLEFPEWHKNTLQFLRTVYDKETRSFTADVVEHFKQQKDLEKFMQKIMSLIVEVKVCSTYHLSLLLSSSSSPLRYG